MKIIISPSKTKHMQSSQYLTNRELLYPTKTKNLVAKLRKLKMNEIARIMNIKGDLLTHVYHVIKDYHKAEAFQAFPSFSGLVFKNLATDSYGIEEFNYIEKNLVILDALYGILEPGTLIKDYRLDMKTHLDVNLYEYWKVSNYFKNDVVINLASSEYSKMVKKEMISISFLQNKDGKFVNQATYSKMARGKFLDFMIQNKIENIEILKQFNDENYTFNETLSSDFEFVFTRKPI